MHVLYCHAIHRSLESYLCSVYCTLSSFYFPILYFPKKILRTGHCLYYCVMPKGLSSLLQKRSRNTMDAPTNQNTALVTDLEINLPICQHAFKFLPDTISAKNSWETQTERCFFPSRAPLVPLKAVYRGLVTKPCTATLRGQGDTKVSQQF